MPVASLTPSSDISTVILPSSGLTTDVLAGVSFGVYADPAAPLYSEDYLSGSVDQVAYTYNKMVGNALNIELEASNVYAAYEEAVLEYSYLVNMHQSKNMLSDVLGGTTGTFDHKGNIKSGALSSSLGGKQVNLKYPKFGFSYAQRVAAGLSTEAAVGGYDTEYSASVAAVANKQDYDLQSLVAAMPEFAATVGNKRILITKVYYKTNRAAWRFYGYYGGLTTVGNFHNYGQWADDSSFEVIPVWHNKLQAIQYENAIYTRLSHFSYELKNNKLRLYPVPNEAEPTQIWFRFYVPRDSWVEDVNSDSGIDGINNVNSIPFDNIPYENINSMGKQWIRDFTFALTLEMLGYVRSKFATIPIPGESVTLNGTELITRGKEQQDRLRDQLNAVLDELTYSKMMRSDADMVNAVGEIQQGIPLPIFVG